MRSEVTKAIEPLRKAGTVGHSLDTHVTLYADHKLAALLRATGTDLRAVFIVSRLNIAPLEDAPETAFASEEVKGLRIGVAKALGAKCERCWIYHEDLGADPDFPGACGRCTTVLRTGGAG